MPQVPIVIANQPVRGQELPRIPRPGGAAFNELGQFGEALSRIQTGYEGAEATRIATTTRETINGILQGHMDQISNPDEFNATANESLKQIQNDTVNSIENPRIKALAQNQLADDFVKAKFKIEHGTWEKKRDVGIASTDEALVSLARQASNENEPNKEGLYQMAGDLLGNMQRLNYFKPEVARAKLEAFNVGVTKNQAINQLRDDPIGLLADINSPKYEALSGEDKRLFFDSAQNAVDKMYSQQDRKGQALHQVFMDTLSPGITAGKVSSQELKNMVGHYPFGITSSEYTTLINDIKAGPSGGKDPEQVRDLTTKAALANEAALYGILNDAQKYAASHPKDPAAAALVDNVRNHIRDFQGSAGRAKSEARQNILASPIDGKPIYDWYYLESKLDKKLESLLGVPKTQRLASIMMQMDAKINQGMSQGEAEMWAKDQIKKDLQSAQVEIQNDLRGGTQKYVKP